MMRPDSQFVTAAAQGGIAEVEMGRLAVQRASDSSVKEFGQHMVDDHSKANEELKTVAARKGLTAPSTVNEKEKLTIDRLSRLSGVAFDKAYMQDMVKDHQEDVSEFKRESTKGTDSEVKAFAGKILPTLQQHLQMAQDIASKLK